MFGALRNRNFRLLWIGSVSAFMAFFTSNVVQAVVAFELTAENRAVGMVVFGRGLGQLLLAPLGGALADRLDKRLLLASSQGVAAAVFFVLSWLMATGRMQVVHLTAGGLLIGLTFAVLGPARSAYIVDLVEPERRGNAVALNQVALNFARVVGPALAGPLLAWATFGPTAAFAVMGLLYAFALVTQLPLPSSRPAAREVDRGLLADVRDGLVYVRHSPRLRSLLLLFVLTIMLGFPYVTVLPGLVEHQLGQPSQRVSSLFAISAVGGLAASLLVARLADTKHAITVYRASGAAFGVSVGLLGLARSFEQAIGLMVLIGLTSGVFTTLNGAVLMRNTDPRYMGRVMSLAMLAFGAFGLIGVPVGALADAIGEGSALAVLGALVCAVVVLQRVRDPGPAELAAQATISRS
jgi:MFS family permease